MILWIVSVLVFAGTESLSGDAATKVLGRYATPESIAVVREKLNLDNPPVERYIDWLSNILRGNLGVSLVADRPVSDVISGRFWNTFILAGATALLLVPLAYLLGTLSAVYRYGPLDLSISQGTLILTALPEFVVGILLVLIFAILWPILPAVSLITSDISSWDHAKALVLPVMTLLAASVAPISRQVRARVIEALESDYVRMARLKGVPEKRVIIRHALQTSLVPSLQVLALGVAWLAGGVVIVEVVFNYPGIGASLVDAVAARDLPVVQALGLFIAALYLGLNFLADLATVLLTPRLRTTLK